MKTEEKPVHFYEMIASGKLTLVCFSATWCGPCQTMIPILAAMQSKFEHSLQLRKVDVDQELDLTVAYKIMGVPTLMLFRKGNLLWRYSDVMPAHALEQIILKYLETDLT